MKCKIQYIIIFVVLLILRVQSQVTLYDAIEIGLKNNFDILIRNINDSIASNNVKIAKADFLPKLSLLISQQNQYNNQNNPASFLNGKYQNINLQPKAQLDWTLFNGFRIYFNKKKWEKLEEQSLGNSEIVIQNTIKAIILAYEKIILERERLQTYRQIKDLSKDEYYRNFDKFNNGNISEYELFQFKNAYLTDSVTFLDQKFNTNKSIRYLNILLGFNYDTNLIYNDKILEPIYKYNFKDLETKSMSNNRNIKNQHINSMIKSYETKVLKSNLYPSVSFQSGILNSTNKFSRDIVNDANNLVRRTSTGTNFSYYFNLTLSYTIFNGGNVRNTIKNAMLNEEIEKLNTDKLKIEIRNNLKNALEEYNNSVIIYEVNKENFKIASLNLNLSKEKYETGVISSFEYRIVQNNYIKISSKSLEALYNVISTHLELIDIVGGIINYF